MHFIFFIETFQQRNIPLSLISYFSPMEDERIKTRLTKGHHGWHHVHHARHHHPGNHARHRVGGGLDRRGLLQLAAGSLFFAVGI